MRFLTEETLITTKYEILQDKSLKISKLDDKNTYIVIRFLEDELYHDFVVEHFTVKRRLKMCTTHFLAEFTPPTWVEEYYFMTPAKN